MDRRQGIPAANINMDNPSYEDKPLELSQYILLLTKEKMVLEAKLKDEDLVSLRQARAKDIR